MTLLLRLLHGAFGWLPCCVFGLYFSAGDYEVLMLLRSGSGVSVRDAWLDINGTSGLQRHHRNLTLRELILEGDFRTDLNVDQLPIDEVYMVFLNALAEPLWWIAFNGTAVEETKWFQEVTQSSSNILDYNANVITSRSSESFYTLYVGTGERVDPAWAAILNSSTMGTPYFIFNADPNSPHEFPRGLTKASYVGCSLYDYFNVIYKSEDSSNMNVEKCAMSCSTFPLVILQMGYKCLCGSSKNQVDGSSPIFIANCDLNCPNSDDKCGGQDSTNVAVYQMMEDEPRDIGQVFCSMMKVNFSEENNEILISKYLHFSDLATNQFYVRGHRLSLLSTIKYSYFMSYDMKDCDNTSRKYYIDMLSGNPQEFKTGDLWNTTLIPAVCIWFFSTNKLNIFGFHYFIDIELEICVPQAESYFFPADYLAIIGTYQQSSINSTENLQNYSDGASVLNSNPSSPIATVYNNSESSTREIAADATSTTEFVSDGPSSPIANEYNNLESSTREITSAATSTSELVSDGVSVSMSPINDSISNSSVTDQSTYMYTAASTYITSSTNSGNQRITSSNANFLCSCACFNITSETLQDRLDHIKSILTVDKKALSSMYRKLNCAQDSRLSSKGIGATGLVILLAIIGIIVLIDLTKVLRF